MNDTWTTKWTMKGFIVSFSVMFVALLIGAILNKTLLLDKGYFAYPLWGLVLTFVVPVAYKDGIKQNINANEISPEFKRHIKKRTRNIIIGGLLFGVVAIILEIVTEYVLNTKAKGNTFLLWGGFLTCFLPLAYKTGISESKKQV